MMETNEPNGGGKYTIEADCKDYDAFIQTAKRFEGDDVTIRYWSVQNTTVEREGELHVEEGEMYTKIHVYLSPEDTRIVWIGGVENENYRRVGGEARLIIDVPELSEQDDTPTTDGGRSLSDPERIDSWECDECERETETLTYETSRGVRWFQCSGCGALKDLFGDVEFEDDENAGKELVTDGGEDESEGIGDGDVFEDGAGFRLEITGVLDHGLVAYTVYDGFGDKVEHTAWDVQKLEEAMSDPGCGYERVE